MRDFMENKRACAGTQTLLGLEKNFGEAISNPQYIKNCGDSQESNTDTFKSVQLSHPLLLNRADSG